MLGPDLQPLHFSDEIRDQVQQAAAGGDGSEMRQTTVSVQGLQQAGKEVAFHESANRADRLGAASSRVSANRERLSRRAENIPPGRDQQTDLQAARQVGSQRQRPNSGGPPACRAGARHSR